MRSVIESGAWWCATSRGPVVYVLIEAASHYYQVMTRSQWMPSLLGERIGLG